MSMEKKRRWELRTDSSSLLLPLTGIAFAFSKPAFQLLWQPVVAVLTHRFQVDLYEFVSTRAVQTWSKGATGRRQKDRDRRGNTRSVFVKEKEKT